MFISQEASVLLTLSYVDQFSFPLTETEIMKRLLMVKISNQELKSILKTLEIKRLITHHETYWKLNESINTNWQNRKNRKLASQNKWIEVEKIVKLIAWIPWIKGVGVTGSLAMDNVTPGADIDLMIITSTNRLWISRALLFLSLLRIGKRRTWKGNELDSWCFNLWLDEKNLSLPKNKQDLYAAYEVCQTKWIYIKENIADHFYQHNQWVASFLPTYFEDLYVNKNVYQPQIKSNYLLTILNKVSFGFQYFYMYSHMSREDVNLGSAYFHPRRTKKYIYERWYNSLLNLWQNHSN